MLPSPEIVKTVALTEYVKFPHTRSKTLGSTVGLGCPVTSTFIRLQIFIPVVSPLSGEAINLGDALAMCVVALQNAALSLPLTLTR
jgi:hypothetical protein